VVNEKVVVSQQEAVRRRTGRRRRRKVHASTVTFKAVAGGAGATRCKEGSRQGGEQAQAVRGRSSGYTRNPERESYAR
jgi:hypothetical protein